jgi:hypothetical protein
MLNVRLATKSCFNYDEDCRYRENYVSSFGLILLPCIFWLVTNSIIIPVPSEQLKQLQLERKTVYAQKLRKHCLILIWYLKLWLLKSLVYLHHLKGKCVKGWFCTYIYDTFDINNDMDYGFNNFEIQKTFISTK